MRADNLCNLTRDSLVNVTVGIDGRGTEGGSRGRPRLSVLIVMANGSCGLVDCARMCWSDSCMIDFARWDEGVLYADSIVSLSKTGGYQSR